MKKIFVMPLVAAVVAAGGAFATTGFGAEEDAYGKIGTQCMEGTLLEPQNCSAAVTEEQCEVEINGQSWPAYADEDCLNEIFRQPESR